MNYVICEENYLGGHQLVVQIMTIALVVCGTASAYCHVTELVVRSILPKFLHVHEVHEQ